MPLPTRIEIAATDAEIVAHLEAEAVKRRESAAFQAGDPVVVTDRTGLPDDALARNFAVVLADDPESNLTIVMGLHTNGVELVIGVRTAALAKYELPAVA